MRILQLSDGQMMLLCFIVWALLHMGAALLCLYLPDRFFRPDRFLYRSRRFEDEGRFYDRVFRVRKWKHLLPDGGTVWKKKGYAKRHLKDISEGNLERFLLESCRAELTHWLCIAPFWVFGFFTPPEVIWMMLAYALAANFPCIVAQRFNRPRVKRLMDEREQRRTYD